MLDSFSSPQVHPDVPAGVRVLADGGLRLGARCDINDLPLAEADRLFQMAAWGGVRTTIPV